MEHQKQHKLSWLRWFLVIPAVVLWLAIALSINGQIINEDKSKILIVVETLVWSVFVTGGSFTAAASAAPTHRIITGTIMGIIVTILLLIFYQFYVTKNYGYTLEAIAQVVGFIVGLFTGYFVIRDKDFFRD